jgi:hypothetical protein
MRRVRLTHTHEIGNAADFVSHESRDREQDPMHAPRILRPSGCL